MDNLEPTHSVIKIPNDVVGLKHLLWSFTSSFPEIEFCGIDRKLLGSGEACTELSVDLRGTDVSVFMDRLGMY